MKEKCFLFVLLVNANNIEKAIVDFSIMAQS